MMTSFGWYEIEVEDKPTGTWHAIGWSACGAFAGAPFPNTIPRSFDGNEAQHCLRDFERQGYRVRLYRVFKGDRSLIHETPLSRKA